MSKIFYNFTYFVLAYSYLTLMGFIFHVLTNTWSGIASVSVFLTLLFSLPFLSIVLIKLGNQALLNIHQMRIYKLSKIFMVLLVILVLLLTIIGLYVR